MAVCWPTDTEHLQPQTAPLIEKHRPYHHLHWYVPDSPLLSIPTPGQARSLEFVQAQQTIKTRRLLHAFEKIHKDVSQSRSRKRQAAINFHNEKTHVQDINFEVGDYVLVAKRLSNADNKPRVKWRGPQRVARAVSALVFEVEDLLSHTPTFFHANRLTFYADSKLDVTETLLDTMAHNNTHYNTVEELLDLRYNDVLELYEFHVR